MGISLDIAPSLDIAAARREANKVSDIFRKASTGIGTEFSKNFSGGLREASSDVQKLAIEYRRAYDKAADSAGKLRVQEEKLKELRDSNVTGSRLSAQAERVAAAMRAEARAVRETSSAYKQMNQAATSVRPGALSKYGSEAAAGFQSKFTDGLKGGAIGAGIALAIQGGLSSVVKAGETLGRAFAGALESSIRTGVNFDRIVNEFQGVTQATASGVEQMKAKARELGSDVTLPGVSTAQAGQAITQLVKDGFTAQQALEGVRGVLELATAGQIEAADAAEILGDNINMFQLKATDATHVADVFAATVNASSVSMRDMQLAMSMGGNMAHGFGMSIEQTAAAIGALGQMGIKGSDAGTLLKTMLKQLVNPSAEVTHALNRMGVTVADSQGKFIGFESILGQLTRAAQSMREMDFNQMASEAFGSDAIRGAIFAAKDGVTVYRNMLTQVGRVGAAHQMAAAQMQGWPGVIEGIKNSVEGMQMTVYGALDRIARSFGPGLVGSVDQFATFLREHEPEIIRFFTVAAVGATNFAQTFIAAGEAIMFAMGPIVGGVTGLISGILGGIGGMAKTLATAIQPLAKLGIIPKEWADGLRDFGDGMVHAAGTSLQFNQTWANGISTLEQARSSLSGLATDIANAGASAKEAAEFSRALGKAHAEIRGTDIVITDNTPEVEQHLKSLGIKVAKLPDGSVKVSADTDAARKILDAWRRDQEHSPINVPIRPVIADAGEFQAKMLEWVNAIKEGRNPAMPSFDPHGGAPRVGGGLGRSYGAPAPAPAALPPWAPTMPDQTPKGSGSVHGSGSRFKSDADLGEFYFGDGMSTVDAATRFAQGQSGKPYGFGSVGPDMYDCSGFMSDIFAILTGRPYTGSERYFSTESNFPSLGFQQGFMPGAFNIGVRHGGPGGGHMAGTLPNGVNVESSSGGVKYGQGAAGALNFPEQWHLVTEDMAKGHRLGTGRGASHVTVDNFGSDAQASLGKIGTDLPEAFGLGEGLPGIAKWITGFLANMAFAPALGALSAGKQVADSQHQAAGIPTGGSGLFGMMGAMNPSMLGGGAAGGLSGMAGGVPGNIAGAFGAGAPGMGMPVMGMGAPGAGPFGMGTPGTTVLGPGAPGMGPAGYPQAGPMGFGGGRPMPVAGGAGVPGFGTTPGQPGYGYGPGAPGMPGATGYGYGPGMPGTQGAPAGSIAPSGAPGAQIGPTGLYTPKPVGRVLGEDVPQSSGMSFGGGLIGMATSAGAGAANMMAPGAGAGMQMGMDAMNRTAGYIAQLGGIAATGLLETFALTDTAAADPTNTLLGRIAMGVAGARPQLPNMAGQGGGKGVASDNTTGDQPPQPGTQAQNGSQDQPQRPWVNIENFHNGSGNPSDGAAVGKQMAREMRGAEASAGAIGGGRGGG